MKILTNAEYKELLVIKSDNDLIESQRKEIKNIRNEYYELIAKHEREVANLNEEHEIELKRATDAVDSKVYDATVKMRTENTALTIANKEAQKELEVMRKAFANMDYDVKDTKEIISKLVDGISSKNTVNVVK